MRAKNETSLFVRSSLIASDDFIYAPVHPANAEGGSKDAIGGPTRNLLWRLSDILQKNIGETP